MQFHRACLSVAQASACAAIVSGAKSTQPETCRTTQGSLGQYISLFCPWVACGELGHFFLFLPLSQVIDTKPIVSWPNWHFAAPVGSSQARNAYSRYRSNPHAKIPLTGIVNFVCAHFNTVCSTSQERVSSMVSSRLWHVGTAGRSKIAKPYGLVTNSTGPVSRDGLLGCDFS